MNLVHPLSQSVINLPPQTSIQDYEDDRTYPSWLFTSSAALSANPSGSSDFVLMIVHSAGGMYLGYWRPKDKLWTMVGNQGPYAAAYSDLTYYQDQFYAITYNGQVWGCRFSGPRDHVPARKLITMIDSRLVDLNYIVGSGGVLLVVAREEHEEDVEEEIPEDYYAEEEVITLEDKKYGLVNFHVYELDLIKGGYKQIKNLGDRAIFAGHNTSMSLDCASEFPGIKSNHVYFTDDREDIYVHLRVGGGKNMGSYNLEDAQITKFRVGESLSRINPLFWFVPSL